MSIKLYDAEIEYLESTGTQWINTGIKPDNTYTFDTKIAALQDNYNCVYWGVRSAGTSGDYNKQCFCNSNTTDSGGDWAKAISLYSTRAMSGEGNWTSGIVPTLRTMYSFTNMTVVSTMETMTYPITLFAFNVMGSINTSAGICRIGAFTAYSSGIKVIELIPVRVGNVGYMYDKVSGQLFGNSGTGSFVLGPDVAPAAYANEVAFLESWGNQYIDTGIKPSTDTKIELKCLYCKSGAGLTNYGALIGADDRDTAYTLNHSAVANFTYGLEFSNNFANPQTRLLTFDSTASPQNMRVYDEGGSLVTTLTCLRGVFEVNQNLYLFATNRNGTPVYGSNRILYCKIYDGDTLVRDYVPIEYNGIGYMYDKVSGLFFDNKGTGKFLFGSIAKACARSYTRRQLMAENYVGKAPNGYKWLEYIENTSTAYINTGLKGKANLKIDATWLFKQSEVAGVMGASYSHKPNNALLYRANWTTGSYFYYGDSTAALTALTLNKKWHIVMDKGKLYYDDVLKKTLASTGDSTYNFMLFKVEDFGTCVKGQLFGCKIWDEVTLVRDYRPIKRLSDNKYGLWDIVHQSFYTSPNGVNFVGG